MQVRLLRPIAYRKVGVILDVPSGTAEMWIEQRKAELVPASVGVQQMIPPKQLDVTAGSNRRRRMVTA